MPRAIGTMENNIPKITTRETEHLRSLYPCVSHLEAGRVAEWLSERKDQLLEQAQEAENEADGVRVLGLIAAGIGTVCYAVNPFMLVGGMIGGAAWLWFVVDHYNRTKEIAPLPFVRGNFLDALSRAGDYDARQGYQSNQLAETIKFLPRRNAQEYVFLHSDFLETVIDYLTQVEAGKRFYAYRWLLGWFEKLQGRGLPAKDQLTNHLQNVVIDSQVKVDEVKAIQSILPDKNNLLQQAQSPQPEVQPVITETENTNLPDVETEREDLAFKSLEEDSTVTMDTLIAKGDNFVDTLTNTTLSCIFLGIPGTGKTTILGVAIGRMRRKHGANFTVEIVAMKGDSLLNVHPIVFYRDTASAFEAIYRALREHRRRAAMPKEKRLEYAKTHPYRLIIDDYTSQQQKLNGIFKDFLVEYGFDKDGNPLEIKLPLAIEDALNELWFNGRETNVGIWVGTHSEIVDDLRFVSSKSGRSSGLLCFMGRRDKTTNQGHYDIVSGNLKTLIISDKQHLEILKKQFPQAMQLAYEKDKPLALISGIDKGAFGFALIPDLTREYQNYLLGVTPGEGEGEGEKDDENDSFFETSHSSPSLKEETLEPLLQEGSSSEAVSEESEYLRTYTPSNLTPPHLKQLIQTLKTAGVGQEQIITSLWLVSKGGGKNARWQKAREEYRQVMNE